MANYACAKPLPQATPFTSAPSLVARGFHVFPIVAGEKRPAVVTGFKASTQGEQQIDEWIRSMPASNVGIATGSKYQLLVVDVDVKNGAPGMSSLDELRARIQLPDTLTAQTWSGGLHFYYRLPKDAKVKSRVGILPGIDIRADGGYVVAPPSVISASLYRWVDGCGVIADAPPELISYLNGREPIAESDVLENVIPVGRRNAKLMQLAVKQVKKGRTRDEVMQFVCDANAELCSPPLHDEEVMQIVNNVCQYSNQGSFHLTDMGNAKRMRYKFGKDIRYVVETGHWLQWQGNFWVNITNLELMALAKEIPQDIRDEGDKIVNDVLRKAVIKHANASEGAQKIQHMIELFKSELGIAVSVAQLDQHAYLFGVENGVVNLVNGRLKEGTREMLITQVSHIAYDPAATCPTFERFVKQIMNNDMELVEYLQKALGYTLTGSIEEQCLFFLYGFGANGKSTFLNIQRALLGDYGTQAAGETLLEQNRSSNAPSGDLARLRGKRGVLLSELEDGKQFAESLLKSLTGGDLITARHLYKDIFEYRPVFKLWLAANHKPTIKGNGYSIWRRMRLVPFSVTFAKEDQDPQLEDKLKAELPGILNWAIRGALAWRTEGLSAPKAIRAATEEYRAEMDVIGNWLENCVMEGENYRSSFDALFKSFEPWCKENHNWTFSKRRFGMMLKERGFVSKKTPQLYYHGLALREDVPAAIRAELDKSKNLQGLFSDDENVVYVLKRKRTEFYKLSLSILGLPDITEEECDEQPA